MKKFTAIGCYIFAGGFTIGMSKHVKVLAHLEETDFGVATFKNNFNNIPVYIGPENWPKKKFKGVDIVYGNPPCAAWSAVGKSMTNGKDNWKTDSRVNCTRNLFQLLEWYKPKIWIWESVPRAFSSGKPFVEELTKKALRMGYAVTYLFADAQNHGLPQRRRRFHMILHKVALDMREIKPKRVTVGKALRGIKNKWYPRRTAKDLKLIKHTKPGGSLFDTFNRIMPKKLNKKGQVIGRPVFMNFRLSNKHVSPTLIGGCHAVHPTEHRFLTPIEHGVLCGYPKNYKWAGEPQSWYKQAGQSVTSIMGNFLGDLFTRSLRMNRPVKKEVTKVKIY